MMETKKEFKYYAFVSYSHKDKKWANWLYRKLCAYRLPRIVKKSNKDLPRSLTPLFLDEYHLQAGKIRDNINKELDSSKNLIVICSPNIIEPNADGVNWIDYEVEHFSDSGKTNRIIPVLVEGDKSTSFCDTLKKLDVLAQDVPKNKEARVISNVVAGLLELDPDLLWRDEQRRRKKRMIVTSCLAALAILLLSLLGVMYWDWNKEKIFYFRDYVDKYGIPQGLNKISKEEIKGRGQTYRMHYQGYDKLLWGRKPLLRKMFCVNSFDSVIEEKRDLPLHPKVAGRFFFYDEKKRVREVHYADSSSVIIMTLIYSGDDSEYVAVGTRGHDGRWETAKTISEIIGAGSSSKGLRYKVERNLEGFVIGLICLDMKGDKHGVVRYKYAVDGLGRVTSEYREYENKGKEELRTLGNKSLFEYSVEGLLERRYCFLNDVEVSLDEYEYDVYDNLEITRRVATNRELKKDGWVIRRTYYDEFGEWRRVEYLNSNCELIEEDDAVIEREIFYSNGRILITKEKFFKKTGEKGCNGLGAFVVCRTYNMNQLITKEQFYDANNKLLACSKKILYDNLNRIRLETFIDENENPRFSDENGWAEQKIDYIEMPGKRVKKTVVHLNEKGECSIPNTKFQAPCEVLIYDEFGKAESLALFGGSLSNKIVGATGFHRTEFKRNSVGRYQGVSYFDTNEAPVLATGLTGVDDPVAGHKLEFDLNGNLLKTCYYGLNGFMDLKDGYAIVENKYDSKGRLVSTTLYDCNNNPVDPVCGANHKSEYEYDLNSVKVKTTYTSVNGEKTIHEYDSMGRVKKCSCLKPNGDLKADNLGVAIIVYEYDENGKEIKRAFFGENTKRTLSGELVSGWLSLYDDQKRLIRKSFIGLHDELKKDVNGVAIIDFEYDANNNTIAKTFFDANTNLVCNREGIAGVRWGFDSKNNKIKKYKVNVDNKIIVDDTGVGVITYDYNEKQQCVARRFYDGNHKRIKNKEGIGGWLSEWDERGNEIKRRWIDENDKPCLVTGRWGWRRRYDSQKRIIEEAELGEDGNIICTGFEIEGEKIFTENIICKYDRLGRREVWLHSRTPKGYYGADICVVTYSLAGMKEQIKFLNNDTNLVVASIGFARKELKYNDQDELVEESWWDALDRPTAFNGICRSEIRYLRNREGLSLSVCHFGTNGFYVVNPKTGWARSVLQFDKEMRLISMSFYNGVGNPASVNGTTVSSAFAKYDDFGRVISIKYKTVDGKGCIGDKCAGFEIEYLLDDRQSVKLTMLDVRWRKIESRIVKLRDIHSLIGIAKFRYTKDFIQSFCN